MKAASLASLLLLLISAQGFGHGVERGGAMNAEIFANDFDFLSESDKSEISKLVSERCNLEGLLRATAERAETETSANSTFSIRLFLEMKQASAPIVVIVKAERIGVSATGDSDVLKIFGRVVGLPIDGKRIGPVRRI